MDHTEIKAYMFDLFWRSCKTFCYMLYIAAMQECVP